jgi:hypothetical protein
MEGGGMNQTTYQQALERAEAAHQDALARSQAPGQGKASDRLYDLYSLLDDAACASFNLSLRADHLSAESPELGAIHAKVREAAERLAALDGHLRKLGGYR